MLRYKESIAAAKARLPARLSFKLLAAILPPIIVAVSGIVWLEYHLTRRQMLDGINRQIRFLAQRTAGDIDELLDQRYRDLFTLAETPLIADYYHNVDYGLLDEAETYRKELERYLGNFARRSPGYARILYLDKNGRALCRIGGAPDSPAAIPAEDFAAAAKAAPGGWWVSPVEEFPGVGPIVYYAKPVRDDFETLKGMLVLAYDLAQVRGLLRNIEVGKNGHAYVRLPDGHRLEGRGLIQESGLLTASSALKRRPWTVFVEAPLSDFLDPLRSIRNAALLIAFLGDALLAAILLLVVRSITRPIAGIAAAAHRIGDGDLDYRIKEFGADELGTLSRAFNEMAERLGRNRKQTAQLQSQLIQAEKLSAVGQLISAVAHELNNPLAAISGYVQLSLLDDCPPRMRDDLSHMYTNVLRCRKVVDNLLFFVRQSRHERKRVDLNEAVGSALDLLEYRLVKTEDVRVVTELAPRGVEIAGDFQQIVQVLVNLIGNACDAMQGLFLPDGKRLKIRTGTKEERAFIEIEDSGAGIALEHQDAIFQPFFTTKEAGRGTGLGLSICRQIAQEHGGDIFLESRPGHGALFRLALPPGRKEDFEALEALSTPTPYEAVPGRKVLVVDDEKDIAALIARLLKEDGDEVKVAHNGAVALKLIAENSYDLVISDIEMEHAKGTDLYAALAARGALASCRMLFVTGDILNPKVLEFLSKTNSEYLVKPFDIHELRQTARRLLGRVKREFLSA
jgi:signal transduction histidine kinase/ActR/RegA family two-component response regulator